MSKEIASQMSDMNWNIQSLMSRFGKQPMVADQLCVKENHRMNMYSMVEPIPLRNEEIQVVYPPRQARQHDDPFSNTYNLGWSRHPNLSYGNNHCLNHPLP